MPSTYLAYRHAMARIYETLAGKPSVETTFSRPMALGARSSELQRARQNDTDGCVRRANETKHRHQMH
jgi:hypothetical protein